MAEISIIIPFLDNWSLTHQRLMDIYKHIPDCEVVLVDDGSQMPDSLTGPKWWTDNFKNIKLVRNSENLGFSKSNNIGAENASGDLFIFTQNDVLIGGNFVPQMLAYLQKEKTIVGGEIVNHPAGWNEFEINGQKFFMPYLVGWMLGLWRKDWEVLGGFDERYSPMDFEDVDLSTTALYNGYDLVELKSPYLKHLFGRTTTKVMGVEGRRKITERNRQQYIEKWGSKLIKLRSKVIADVS